jgi:hypothetical protein
MEYQGRTFRHELKYAINDVEYHALRSRLRSILHPDENARETGEYHIRSLYFDDFSDSSFNDKEAGVFQRGKYRIRIYNRSDSVIRLEFKEKFDNYISKSGRLLTRATYEKILHRKQRIEEVRDDSFLLDFYMHTRIDLLSPRIIIDYVREPFICEAGNVRITFDKHLKASLRDLDVFQPNPLLVTPPFPGTMILEVKYDDYLPEYIRRSLSLSRHQHMAASKYTICREVKNAFDWKENIL